MSEYYIGEPVSADRLERLMCGLRSTLPEQVGEQCDQHADLHLLVRHPEHGSYHHLLTCMRHHHVAAGTGELVADHELGLWCGLAGTRFDVDRNVCMPDDSGIEP